MTSARPVRQVDFLTAAFEASNSVSRAGNVFHASRPWAIVRFGGFVLAAGWWTLECEGDGALDAVEVRMGSAENPLIVFPGDRAGNRPGAFRILLRRPTVFDVSLLVAVWPGDVEFSRLRLRRQTAREDAGLALAALRRLSRSSNPFARIGRVLRHLAAGRSIGMQIADMAAPPVQTTAGQAAVIQSGPLKLLADDGIAVIVEEGQELDPRAFAIARRALADNPAARFAYADRRSPYGMDLQMGWNPELAAHAGLPASPVFIRRTAQTGAGIADPAAQLRALAASGEADAGVHIALPLAAGSPQAFADLPALPAPDLPRTPSISIVIPTKYKMDLLDKCLAGLSATDYPDMEVVIVDNGSTDPRLPDVLARARRALDLSVIVDAGGFNFSRLINAGVRVSRGELVVLLNDDIEPISGDWLRRMAASLLRSDVGAVGARLLYPDGTIQHAGLMMGLGGVCGHLWKSASPEAARRNPHIVYPGFRTAVTGACLGVRRSVFDEAAGLDEAFAVAFNDIDFCLRLRQLGYRNIYRGDAALIHHESQSRGHDVDPASMRRLASETDAFLRRWRDAVRDDPYGSSALDPMVESGRPHRSLTAS
jgi:GT2 family glycosyltransferase